MLICSSHPPPEIYHFAACRYDGNAAHLAASINYRAWQSTLPIAGGSDHIRTGRINNRPVLENPGSSHDRFSETSDGITNSVQLFVGIQGICSNRRNTERCNGIIGVYGTAGNWINNAKSPPAQLRRVAWIGSCWCKSCGKYVFNR